MPNINITVAEKIATNTTPGVVIVCGNSDYKVAFDFDEEWAAATERVARFLYYKDGLSLYQDVAFTGNTVAVPILYNVAYVLVGVYAGNLRTTTPAKVLCDRSILCGDPLEVLTPEEKAKLQAQIGDPRQLQTSAKGNLVAAINEVAQSGEKNISALVLIRDLLYKVVYTENVTTMLAQLDELLENGGDADVSQTGSILSIVSGVTVTQSGSALSIV